MPRAAAVFRGPAWRVMNILIANIILALLLAAAVIWDLRVRKIPNGLTLPVVVVALGASFAAGGASSLWFSTTGLLAGFGLMLFPYIFGGMGGGDVKLMAAVGALKGASFAFHAFLFAAIAGGVIALAVAAARGRLKTSLRNIKHILLGLIYRTGLQCPSAEDSAAGAFPYAGAIAIGVAAAEFLMPLLPF